MAKYYNDRERYGINASSLQVGRAEDKRETSHGTLTLGEEPREPSPSEVHLGVDRNIAGTSDVRPYVCTLRRFIAQRLFTAVVHASVRPYVR